MMIILDQDTHYAETLCIKDKSQAFSCFQLYRKRAQTLHKAKIQILRIDGGGKFNSDAFLSLIHNKGIRLERTIPYSSRENPQSERINRTILDMARYMLHFSGTPQVFWREAVMFATYIQNISPTKALNKQTPYEL
jgi:predicted signal transduction protein with EAL and GGDEF domain